MTQISGRISISEKALMVDLENEAVILNLNNERYYGLDDVSKNFWHWLNEFKDVDQVLHHAVDAYQVEEEVIRKDLGGFLLELSKAGLISFDGEQTS
ncbi:hypothetical protein GCM10007939_04250 [Amylibacter marinus]|uniref:Coenzyme PQQ synthesis protein D (PqqD) n=1 Tax=Amylibacter marinus TaxID=1475483 RepID=A0ABQ5VSM3_9RHOB|nr:PqqD family protein [Amylibacter marinus]GLQ34142.1 hypothetical protein GCM10007939_04250 [Amylibacter marinus]